MGQRSKGKNGKRATKHAKRTGHKCGTPKGAKHVVEDMRPEEFALRVLAGKSVRVVKTQPQQGESIASTDRGLSKRSRQKRRKRDRQMAERASQGIPTLAEKRIIRRARDNPNKRDYCHKLESQLGERLLFVREAPVAVWTRLYGGTTDAKLTSFIFRPAEYRTHEALTKDGSEIGETLVLWHGTCIGSGAPICMEGFKCGRSGMFGGAVYLGPREKAWNYVKVNTTPYTKGTQYIPGTGLVTTETYKAGILIQCSVAVGRVYDAKTSLHRCPPGYDTVHGVQGQTEAWVGSLLREEYAIYDPRRIVVRSIHVIIPRISRQPEIGIHHAA